MTTDKSADTSQQQTAADTNSQQPVEEYVTKGQLAATLRAYSQLLKESQQQASEHVSTKETATTQSGKGSQTSSDSQVSPEVLALQKQLADMQAEAAKAKQSEYLGKAMSKAGLHTEAEPLLRATLAGMRYSEAVGDYVDTSGQTFSEYLDAFVKTPLGSKLKQQQPDALPKTSKAVYRGSTAGTEKPKPEDLLMQAFGDFLK